MATLVVGAPARAAPPATMPAAELRAALLEHLAQFVGWPGEAFPGDGDPFVLCTAGLTAEGRVLARTAARHRVHGRAIQVRTLSTPAHAARCHLIWVPLSMAPWIERVQDVTRGKPVLTVTESTAGSPHGVHLTLVVNGPRLEFEVDLVRAHDSGLTPSAKLLALARHVWGEPGSEPE